MSNSTTTENLQKVIADCQRAAIGSGRPADAVRLIAVSKTFDGVAIRPALEAGHRIFGENRVQEAYDKWPKLSDEFDDIELHLIGPLQSNKAGDAVALFEFIHAIDREKIASAVAKEMKRQQKFPVLLVQVNTGLEPQKAGIEPQKTAEFVNLCREKYDLDIKGLMCIPPLGENPGPHFALLQKLGHALDLPLLSMGMSGDYKLAIEMGATHVRVGSAIFGERR